MHEFQVRFQRLLPRIELHGRIFFRHVRPQHEREEMIAELVAICWKWFVRLARRGKAAEDFVVTFCRFAGFAVQDGRRLCGHEKSKDVLSARAQRVRGFEVVKLPDCETLSGNPIMEALTDNNQTPPDEAAAFRIDFPRWLKRWSARDRRVIQDAMMGERTLDVSQKYGISPGRVSQLRQQFHDDWQRFNGETEPQLAAA